MQITSTLTQQNMDPTNGNLVASSPIEPLTAGSADQVAGAFCRAFYTSASESRETISKFYGHESLFHFEEQVVTGATEISKQYNNLPESSHFKIHSIKGLPTLHRQGVLINVLGTLNHRPFTQSFILGQQGQKKYYVEVDYLQFIDKFFDSAAEKPAAAPVAAAPTPSKGHSNGVNGKVVKQQQHAEEPKQPVKQTPQKSHPTPKKEETPRAAKQETPKAKEEKKPQPVQKAPAPAAAPAPIPEPVPQEPPKPRTWAHLVGGGGKQQPPQQQNFGPPLQQQQMHHQMQQQQQAMHQQQMFQQQQQQRAQQSASNEHHGEENANERKIYLGGITREIVPSNTAQAETEIKQVFYKYGEVEEVRMPRKVLESPNDMSKHAFAFITMRSKDGVQAIFAGASRDEQGVWKLPLKLDAFGFDGLAQISEQRDPPAGGFRGGRGGFQRGGGGGGQFYRGGRGGGAPRGGPRGFPNGQH